MGFQTQARDIYPRISSFHQLFARDFQSESDAVEQEEKRWLDFKSCDHGKQQTENFIH